MVVFGAGGRAGRRAVAEAVTRGHRVTAVVRDPDRYRAAHGEPGAGVSLVAGDVTDAGSVAAVAAGHDVAVNAAARMDVPAREFFTAAARALLAGLERAGVPRLVMVGIGTTLETAPGVRVMDAPGFPEEARNFSEGHAAELAIFEAEGGGVDWVMMVPPPTLLDDEAPRTGRYRTGGDQVLPAAEDAGTLSYADLAVALIDEAENPKHHHRQIAVAP
ncbi:hypothetical protein Ssi03_24800 [Sphaerisporangium siamense]|nr:hypothetical protein Ssi03_24800 [Sphaerisporangium siamense]